MSAKYADNQLAFDLPGCQHPITVERRAQRRAARERDESAAKAAMVERHRDEWDLHLDLWHDALFMRSDPLAKLAKTLAETLRIRQADERAAWGDMGISPTMDPETRRRRIAELAKEIGLVVISS